ncbi:MAG: PspC domain-containing protein [Muribaculaceae bacterium]|nr:PspC domain-containing protein [Muribaculaceae bacterium]
MKITYNINLDGRVFTIDEDAYRLLDDYLETLKHAFTDTENQEIIKDIEARISEIFFIEQDAGKSVITLCDVEAVITRIGHPEELIEEISETEIETEKESVLPPPLPVQGDRPQKRLYRDSRNGMIGGVCAGLAEYLNVDVTWVRLVAVGLCFISLSTLAFAYIILWIVLPNAETPLQRMQLTGESPTLQNIGHNVKEFFNNQNSSNKYYDYGNKDVTQTQGSKRFVDNLADFFGVIAKILLFIVLIICIPVEVALAMGLLGCVVGLIALSTAAGTTFFMGIPYFDGMAIWQLVAIILCAVGVILFIGIPLFLLIRILMSGDKNPMKTSTKIAAIISWIIAIVLTCTTAVMIYGSFIEY